MAKRKNSNFQFISSLKTINRIIIWFYFRIIIFPKYPILSVICWFMYSSCPWSFDTSGKSSLDSSISSFNLWWTIFLELSWNKFLNDIFSKIFIFLQFVSSLKWWCLEVNMRFHPWDRYTREAKPENMCSAICWPSILASIHSLVKLFKRNQANYHVENQLSHKLVRSMLKN